MYAESVNSSRTRVVPCQCWNFDDSIYSQTIVTKVSPEFNTQTTDYTFDYAKNFFCFTLNKGWNKIVY